MKRGGPLKTYKLLSRGTKQLKRTKLKWKPRSRTTKTRTILYGAKYSALRRQRFDISGGICECGCGRNAPWEFGQLAHLDRGAKRNSVIDRVKWMRPECHDLFDNRNQKVVPKKCID